MYHKCNLLFHVTKVPSIIRNSKWNSDNWTKGKFTTNIDPECLTLYDVFRRGLRHSSKLTTRHRKRQIFTAVEFVLSL